MMGKERSCTCNLLGIRVNTRIHRFGEKDVGEKSIPAPEVQYRTFEGKPPVYAALQCPLECKGKGSHTHIDQEGAVPELHHYFLKERRYPQMLATWSLLSVG
jgi:hypothetical protein